MTLRGRAALWLLPVLLGAGCSTVPVSDPSLHTGSVQQEPRRVGRCPSLDADQELVISLSAEMMAEGRLHAALANLESLPSQYPEVRLRKARILRLLNDDRAEPLFSSLLNSCLNAEAHHGLGQIAAARGQYSRARDYLDLAARLAPADAAIRNDRGLVLMHLDHLPQARFELLTAVELNPASAQALDNLLTLLIYADQWKEAGELVRHRNVGPERFQKAEERARQMQLQKSAFSSNTESAEKPRSTRVGRRVANNVWSGDEQ